MPVGKGACVCVCVCVVSVWCVCVCVRARARARGRICAFNSLYGQDFAFHKYFNPYTVPACKISGLKSVHYQKVYLFVL